MYLGPALDLGIRQLAPEQAASTCAGLIVQPRPQQVLLGNLFSHGEIGLVSWCALRAWNGYIGMA